LLFINRLTDRLDEQNKAHKKANKPSGGSASKNSTTIKTVGFSEFVEMINQRKAENNGV